MLGDGSMLVVFGEPHRRQRTLMQPAFHGDRMREYGNAMRAVTSSALTQLKPGDEVRSTGWAASHRSRRWRSCRTWRRCVTNRCAFGPSSPTCSVDRCEGAPDDLRRRRPALPLWWPPPHSRHLLHPQDG